MGQGVVRKYLLALGDRIGANRPLGLEPVPKEAANANRSARNPQA
jgi:hypothetical protein